MFLLVFFVIAPIIELFVIIQVGAQVGALNTIALLIVGALLGAWIIKYAGIRAFGRFSRQVASGRNPTREIADGVCLLAAGTLLLLPGFISDAIALLLLFPPTRALARNWLMRRKSLGGLGRVRVIRTTYDRSGRPVTNVTDVTEVTDVTDAESTEIRGELDP